MTDVLFIWDDRKGSNNHAPLNPLFHKGERKTKFFNKLVTQPLEADSSGPKEAWKAIFSRTKGGKD